MVHGYMINGIVIYQINCQSSQGYAIVIYQINCLGGQGYKILALVKIDPKKADNVV